MGRNPWYWFCESLDPDGLSLGQKALNTIPVPIGQSVGDGLSYPTNPRFSDDGIWRPRSQWPTEYQ